VLVNLGHQYLGFSLKGEKCSAHTIGLKINSSIAAIRNLRIGFLKATGDRLQEEHRAVKNMLPTRQHDVLDVALSRFQGVPINLRSKVLALRVRATPVYRVHAPSSA
jgi:hypothetical protein